MQNKKEINDEVIVTMIRDVPESVEPQSVEVTDPAPVHSDTIKPSIVRITTKDNLACGVCEWRTPIGTMTVEQINQAFKDHVASCTPRI